MTDQMPRPPKKSEMLEVRLDHETKQNFLAACRRAGRTASDVVREAVDVFIARDRERPDFQPEQGRLIAMIPRPIRRKRFLAAAGGLAGLTGLTMLAAFPSAADPDLRATFHRIDSNADGVISPEEFFGKELPAETVTETRRSIRQDRPAPDPTAMRVFHEAYASIFPRAEGDPGGEWGWELSISGGVENAPDDFDYETFDFRGAADFDPLAAVFIDMDADEDDAISYAEFETKIRALFAKTFARLDRDGDGYLDEMEFMRSAGWMRETAEDGTEQTLPDELMKAGFGKLDTNKDGRLSLQEYLPPA